MFLFVTRIEVRPEHLPAYSITRNSAGTTVLGVSIKVVNLSRWRSVLVKPGGTYSNISPNTPMTLSLYSFETGLYLLPRIAKVSGARQAGDGGAV